METVSGQPITRKYTPVPTLIASYEEALAAGPLHMGHLGNVLSLLLVEGAHDYSEDNATELLNPGQKYFKPQSIEEYAKTVSIFGALVLATKSLIRQY